MTKLRMPWFWPLGLWPLLIPSVLILILVLSGTSALWSLPYQDWLATSSTFMTQLAITGPVSAAAAAYYASRSIGTERIFALRPGHRTPAEVLRRHLTLLLTSLLGSYLVGFIPLLIETGKSSDVGGLNVGIAATGVLGIVVFVLLGYATGSYVQTFVSVPIAFVASLAVVVVGTTAASVLSPVPAFSFEIGDIPATRLIVVRIIVMTIFVIALLSFSRGMVVGSRKPSATAVTSICVIFAFGFLVKQTPPDIRTFDPNPPRVCSTSAGIESCVHQGHRRQLTAVAQSALPIITAYGNNPRGAVWRVYDSALSGKPVGAQNVFWVTVSPGTDEEDTVPSDLASQLVSAEACVKKYGFRLPEGQEALYSYLFSWLQNGGERPSSYTYPHFTKMSRTDVQGWLADNRAQLNSCSIDLQKIPL